MLAAHYVLIREHRLTDSAVASIGIAEKNKGARHQRRLGRGITPQRVFVAPDFIALDRRPTTCRQ
jgi:hypothetical protein